MESVTCLDVSNFPNALTRGRKYEVLARDDEKRQIKVSGDNGRVRWYPSYCFASSEEPLLCVKSVTIDDPIRNPYCDAVEVSIVAIRGDSELKRWCYFLTPSFIYTLFERSMPTPPQLLGQHAILVPTLSTDVIRDAVSYLESHNLLEERTLPLDPKNEH